MDIPTRYQFYSGEWTRVKTIGSCPVIHNLHPTKLSVFDLAIPKSISPGRLYLGVYDSGGDGIWYAYATSTFRISTQIPTEHFIPVNAPVLPCWNGITTIIPMKSPYGVLAPPMISSPTRIHPTMPRRTIPCGPEMSRDRAVSSQ
jgi:hypothetical protein